MRSKISHSQPTVPQESERVYEVLKNYGRKEGESVEDFMHRQGQVTVDMLLQLEQLRDQLRLIAQEQPERKWVCENHPNKHWPDECDCGPGMLSK